MRPVRQAMLPTSGIPAGCTSDRTGRCFASGAGAATNNLSMRLPIAGTTELSPATKLAIDDEASIAEADAIAQSVAALRSGGASTETVTRVLVGRTVADVERDLILETLKHCLGNRTRAAAILGISIRTLRNKLNEYAGNGVPVPPPGAGAARPAGC